MRIVIAGRPFSPLRALLKFAAYFGIGALLHAVFHGPVLDPASAWMWAYLLAWPVVALLYLLKWGLVALGWAAVVGLGIGTWVMARDRRAKEAAIMALTAAVIALVLV